MVTDTDIWKNRRYIGKSYIYQHTDMPPLIVMFMAMRIYNKFQCFTCINVKMYVLIQLCHIIQNKNSQILELTLQILTLRPLPMDFIKLSDLNICQLRLFRNSCN